MKILFTADWHIKLGQKNVPKEWQKARYLELFKRLETLQSSADIMVIGGDIFDKMPSLEELSLFFSFLGYVNLTTFIFDGNHEATKKGKTFLSELTNIAATANSSVHILTDNFKYENVDFIPYTNIKNFNPDNFTGNILCTHVRGDIPPHVKAEIDLSKLDRWDVVLAGDLHAYSNSQRNILYPGSPLSTSFHRNPITNGVILFDTETLEHEWIDLKLPQLIRKKVELEEEMVQTNPDHTVYELVGNVKTLSTVDTSNELLDKKIVDKNEATSLSFKGKSIGEEIRYYIEHILKIEGETLDMIMESYYDTIREDDLE